MSQEEGLRLHGMMVEIISKWTPPAHKSYGLFAEVIEGVAIIVDSHRLNGQSIEIISKRTNNPIKSYGCFVEIITGPDLYYPNINVNFLY